MKESASEVTNIKDSVFLTGGQQICVRLHLPAQARGMAVLVHGFSSTMDSSTNSRLVAVLPENGVAVLCFDLRGHGASDGQIQDLTLSAAVEDLLGAVHWACVGWPGLRNVPRVVVGSSFGGAVALAGAARAGACGLVLKAPVSDMASMQREARGEDGMRQWRETGYGLLPGKGGMIPVHYALIEDSLQYDLPRMALESGLPIRIVHGRRDEVVPCEHSERLCALVGDRARLLVLDGGDHQFTDEADFERMSSFLERQVLDLLQR